MTVADNARETGRRCGHVGKGNREERRAEGWIVGEQRVVGEIRHHARSTVRASSGGHIDHIRAECVHGGRFKYDTISVFQVTKQVVGPCYKQNPISFERKRRGCDGRFIDAHAIVVKLKYKTRDAWRVGHYQRHSVACALIQRNGQRDRGLGKVDPVNCTAIQVHIATESRQANLRWIVAAKLSVEISLGREDWGLWNAQRRVHHDKLVAVAQRIHRTVDRP